MYVGPEAGPARGGGGGLRRSSAGFDVDGRDVMRRVVYAAIFIPWRRCCVGLLLIAMLTKRLREMCVGEGVVLFSCDESTDPMKFLTCVLLCRVCWVGHICSIYICW